MSSAASDLVLLSVKNGFATLTLNFPKKLNNLTQEMGRQFAQRIQEIKEGHLSSLKGMVITGAGDAFSSGGDLDFLLERTKVPFEQNVKIMREFYGLFLGMRSVPVPVIAHVNGTAVGAGLCLAMASDVRIVHRDAKLGFPFVKMGLFPGMGSTYFVPKVCAPDVASTLLTLGQEFRGEDAGRTGIATYTYGKEETDFASGILAQYEMLAEEATVFATQSLVRTLREREKPMIEAALAQEAEMQARCYESPEFAEKLRRLIEKVQHKKSSPIA
jgi:enoyl-CoA hydratase/carnithine racemase